MWSNGSEDCLPAEGDIDAVGWSLPEFEILGYPETKQAYYIRCPECVNRFASPKDESGRIWAKAWMDDIQQAEKQWFGEEDTEMMDVETKLEVPPSNVRKEVSPSTNTTEAEEYIDGDDAGKSLYVAGREIIVID